MKEQIEKVKEFHTLFEIPIKNQPEIDQNRVRMRMDILKEEVEELETALINNDLIETADAITDCLYVLLGTAHEFGFQHKLEELFEEVHKSNMSKLDENGKILRRADGKIAKSNLWQPPNIENILTRKIGNK